MIAGVAMKVLHALTGLAVLVCSPRSSQAFLIASSPMVRVPLGLHMTLSPVHGLKLNRNKAQVTQSSYPLRTRATAGPALKRNARRNMSEVSEAAPPEEEQTGFWNKVR